ncbi:hypothetical protein G7046_g3176 [Stylonectria norvegica]|nr:hypothetical protein G7046_g3176 [Stylonectria norvegica]
MVNSPPPFYSLIRHVQTQRSVLARETESPDRELGVPVCRKRMLLQSRPAPPGSSGFDVLRPPWARSPWRSLKAMTVLSTAFLWPRCGRGPSIVVAPLGYLLGAIVEWKPGGLSNQVVLSLSNRFHGSSGAYRLGNGLLESP